MLGSLRELGASGCSFFVGAFLLGWVGVCARVVPSKRHHRVKCIVLVGYGKEALVVDCHHVDVAPNKGDIALTVRAISGQ